MVVCFRVFSFRAGGAPESLEEGPGTSSGREEALAPTTAAFAAIVGETGASGGGNGSLVGATLGAVRWMVPDRLAPAEELPPVIPRTPRYVSLERDAMNSCTWTHAHACTIE